jgi:hypothetical protein
MQINNGRSFRLVSPFSLTLVVILALFGITFFYVLSVGYGTEANRDESMPSDYEILLPLHTSLGKPRPGDWLTKHFELGQTFRQYVQRHPVRADDQRRMIYVQPLGEMNTTQKKIVDLTAEYLGVHYQLPVKVCEILIAFYKANDLENERIFCEKSLTAWKSIQSLRSGSKKVQ